MSPIHDYSVRTPTEKIQKVYIRLEYNTYPHNSGLLEKGSPRVSKEHSMMEQFGARIRNQRSQIILEHVLFPL